MIKELDYNRHYRWWHDESDEHFHATSAESAKWLSRYWPQDKSAKILDIGCGMGFMLGAFRSAGFVAAVGIDANQGQLASTLKRGFTAEYVPTEHTLAWLAARKGQFDFITAVDVIEHIPKQQQIATLSAIREALKSGGTFLCRVPNANSIVAAPHFFADWTHETAFTEHSLDFVLHNAGFGDIRVEDADPFKWRISYITKPYWWLCGFFRFWRRLELAAEFGRVRAKNAPLSTNIIGIGRNA
ncbi:MAG: class I SAM-dependent methyltransferase [Proteobacteria bacterium]|nr:class I SAM-dependent methyltransferase [Pseudomonadota bacterium]